MAQSQVTDVQIAATLLEGVLIALPVWLAAGKFLIDSEDETNLGRSVIIAGFLALFFALYRLSDIIIANTDARGIETGILSIYVLFVVLGIGMIYATMDFGEDTTIREEVWEIAKELFAGGVVVFAIYLLFVVFRVID